VFDVVCDHARPSGDGVSHNVIKGSGAGWIRVSGPWSTNFFIWPISPPSFDRDEGDAVNSSSAHARIDFPSNAARGVPASATSRAHRGTHLVGRGPARVAGSRSRAWTREARPR